MAIGRTGHVAAVLSSGNVLVAGGFGESSAEIYDPNPGTWGTTGSMSTPRATLDASVLKKAGGEIVLVSGGLDASNQRQASAEYYDPTVGQWFSAGSLSVPRSSHRAVTLQTGRVLVAGGVSGVGPSSQFLSAAELYDPATNSWSAASSMVLARGGDHTLTTLLDGRVLVAGGQTDNPSAPFTPQAELYTPDPGSGPGSWSLTGAMSAARGAHSATLLSTGAVLVTGGNTNGPGNLASAELYGTGTWQAVADMSTSRTGHSATLIPTFGPLHPAEVVVAGGFAFTSPDVGGFLSSAEKFDFCGDGRCEPDEASCSCPVDCGADTDGDGLSDVWETSGLDLGLPGVPVLNLAALGANPNHADVFLEVDYMEGGSPFHSHRPPQKWVDDPLFVENRAA
jgi:hypothetical protein